jgi:hypothetical protein
MRGAVLMVPTALAMGLGTNALCQADAASAPVVSRAEAICIADNVDVFLEDADDPVIIYLDICVPSQQLTDLLAGSNRGDLPTIDLPAVRTDSATAGEARTVTLSKAALQCLKAAAAQPGFPSADPVRLESTCP